MTEVFQLPHVALEIQTAQVLDRRIRQALGFDAQLARALLQEMAGEQRDVLAPLAQRRQADADDVEAMEEVFAEQAVLDPRFEILVGRGNHPDIGLDRRMPADAIEMPVRQHAQQARLQLGGHVADFVEEQGAALGLLEAAAPLRLGAGKGAALVAEEFRFEQILGNRCRVDRDERLVGARAVPVQGTRHELLAGTRFAGDQHGRVRKRQAPDGAEDFLHRRRLTENLRHQAFLLGRTALVHRFIDGTPDQFDRLIHVEGLRQVFESATLEGGNSAFQVGIGGHDDDRHRRKTGLHFLQQFKAGLARHADVGHQHLRCFDALFELGNRLAGRGVTLERDALARQGLFQDPADGTIVVNNPDRFHVCLAHLFIGMTKT